MRTMELGSSLIRQLAASDNKTRNRAIRTVLKTWLPSESEISEEDMKKLWKGLFYCVWHSDKTAAQTHLIDRLSSLFPDLPLPLCLHYFSVFLLTLRREWTGIDALRLDKFYLLIRKFIRSFFLLLKKNSWDLELSERLMGVLLERTFLADDQLQGHGVNYHIASVFLEELRPFLPLSKPVIEILLNPFVSVMGKVKDKVLLGKVKSNIFDFLLKMGKKFLEVRRSTEHVDSGDDTFVFGSVSLALGLSSRFYEIGSSIQCCQGNRKLLFGLHDDFSKLEKELASSGLNVSIPEVNSLTDEDQVPNLVPIVDEMEVDGTNVGVPNGRNSTILKKSQKAKKNSSAECKKKKKKKDNSKANSRKDAVDESEIVENNEKLSKEMISDVNLIPLNESLISNLQMQFEKVAEEGGLNEDVGSVLDCTIASSDENVPKRRKRARGMDMLQSENLGLSEQDISESDKAVKSVKKVRFSMKNNLVWKPNTPLPPQSLRIPPSVTPRGSALKKGIPPGPVKDLPAKTKKPRAKSTKKIQNRVLGVSPSVKRSKKLKSVSK
ncbi:hypothetical protein K2173_011516 [Erythroxylum novogranatense]|uniref:Ribosomal RNA processing protein 1 homolog n=1 Tax=Erythroxylum novogranatense TaxID=1862640 RepID=A0AAV8TT99_9ROSI|nr:hypothetical protein K2173_011516 [Erythroxylum novogranatense]